MPELTPDEVLLNALQEECDLLGITYKHNTGAVKLQEKIDAFKAENSEVQDESTEADSGVEDESTTVTDNTDVPETPAREFSDVDPAAEKGTVTEDQLNTILEEFEAMRTHPERPITYDQYIIARGVINRVKALIA